MRLAVRAAIALAAVVTAAIAVVSCAASLFTPDRSPSGSGPASSASPSASPTHTRQTWKLIGGQRVCMVDCRYLGVALPGLDALDSFVSGTGVTPKIVQIYAGFPSNFPMEFANALAAKDQLLMIQLDPYHADLASIAAGDYDSYLTSYAARLQRFGRPVALSFGHEMNGVWYPWGCQHTPASVFVAAYRRVVTVIRDAGADNVIWVWAPNVDKHDYCPVAERWPGKKYVTWVGIDGYMRLAGRTFHGIFHDTFSMIHRFTHKPILITETGILINQPGAPTRIHDLYRGAATTPGVIGVVYFDSETRKYGDYRPQDSAVTLAAFREATSRYLASGTRPG